jgi:hypothetical protein
MYVKSVFGGLSVRKGGALQGPLAWLVFNE